MLEVIDGVRSQAKEVVKNEALNAWVQLAVRLCEPQKVHWCDGSERENAALIGAMVAQGTLMKLDPGKRPRSYLCRSDLRDVARVESRTFICSKNKNDAGPTNNWVDPDQMKLRMTPGGAPQHRQREEPHQQHHPTDGVTREGAGSEKEEDDDRDADRERDDGGKGKHRTGG